MYLLLLRMSFLFALIVNPPVMVNKNFQLSTNSRRQLSSL